MGQLPTILDVAAAAGVSRQTVSNVLNSPSLVRPETREKVEAAIAGLGYRPHASARRLRTQKSSTIGIRLDPLSADGISGSILDRFLHSLTEQADRKDLRVMVFTAADSNDEIRQFKRLSEGADVDAFILTATFHGDPRTQWLIEHGEPFVTFGRPWGTDDISDPEHLWVDVDGRHGIREATIHLLGTGARRIAYIGWHSPSGTGDDRRRGWQQAMEESSGLRPEEIAALHAPTEDGATFGAEALLHLEKTAGNIEAVVCASDALALGAFMHSAGRIPVIGYDNTPVASSIGFSSIEQPIDDVAGGMLELLTGAHGGRVQPGQEVAEPTHQLLQPHLVLRTPRVQALTVRSN
ncbi:LacI family DNA-binding transcriptional regulator [Arthrobacter celericrescens]|uniref:LacI family DNA-binding transcriptional regulator n=1 Tax=Arthrobacter celericrescens TaxID=2320851 RepID=UPI000EA20245|nr:LacI family DNA-binding transcriptional regulator [Arthrobacter celericrescens]